MVNVIKFYTIDFKFQRKCRNQFLNDNNFNLFQFEILFFKLIALFVKQKNENMEIRTDKNFFIIYSFRQL